jgi:hypothetical protein
MKILLNYRKKLNTYYPANAQPKMSNVRPTEAKKARRTTLD